MIGLQSAQAALNTFEERRNRPILAARSAWVSAFRKKVKVVPAMTGRLADEFFTPFVALGRVDDIQTGIERAVQQFRDGLFGGVFVADFRAPKAEERNLHVCLAELPRFHSRS